MLDERELHDLSELSILILAEFEKYAEENHKKEKITAMELTQLMLQFFTIKLATLENEINKLKLGE